LTTKLLFLCKRACPELQTTIAFLTTWVKWPDTNNYKKLSRVIKYPHGTPDLALMLEADNAHVIKWWVDASFAVHKDMHSHTGGSASTCQKINTKSSTEAKLVGIDDDMPLAL
jgi:hypothetical protein